MPTGGTARQFCIWSGIRLCCYTKHPRLISTSGRGLVLPRPFLLQLQLTTIMFRRADMHRRRRNASVSSVQQGSAFAVKFQPEKLGPASSLLLASGYVHPSTVPLRCPPSLTGCGSRADHIRKDYLAERPTTTSIYMCQRPGVLVVTEGNQYNIR